MPSSVLSVRGTQIVDASGTPVIGFASGALTEVIEHGRTGFLVHDETQMAQAIRNCSVLDSAACRAAARERF